MAQQILTAQNSTTAYYVSHYPYLHGQFAEGMFWVETHATYGQRLVHSFRPFTQIEKETNTVQHKSWSKPKKSSYVDLVILEVGDGESGPYAGLPRPIMVDFAEETNEDIIAFYKERDWRLSDTQKMIVYTELSNRGLLHYVS